MKGSDKLLLLILAGIVLLVITAVLLVLRAPEPAYLPEDTPEGVVHNYLLALRQGDYERAYGYLSADLPNRPTIAAFVSDVDNNPWQFERGSDITLTVGETRTFDDGTARTEVVATTYNSGLFGGSQYPRTFGMTLAPDGDSWQLIDGEDYWFYCWSDPQCDLQPLRFD